LVDETEPWRDTTPVIRDIKRGGGREDRPYLDIPGDYR
jgi:hypothetical protein